jgi:hypothetical protein
MKPRPVIATPRPPAIEVEPELTPMQKAKRRRWAQVVCSSAQNETSRAMARRLCKSWFPAGCNCPLQGTINVREN